MGIIDYVLRRTREKLVAGVTPHWLDPTNPRCSPRHRYIVQVILSAPPWVDRAALRQLQYRARCLSEMTGIEHHICHIIPLNHPRVCGLTVPWNLEVRPWRENLSAGNNCILDEQLTLFD